MQVILYKNLSSDNVINKDLTEPLTIDINLRGDFNIIRPELILNGSVYTDYNYLEIPSLNKKYILNNFSSVGNTLYKYSFIIDVLETYYNEFKSIDCLLYRSLKDGDNINVNLDSNLISSRTEHKSDVELLESTKAVLITVGG